MTTANPFIPDKSVYKRDLLPTRSYVEQASFALSALKGISVEDARAFVLKKLQDGSIRKPRNPEVRYLQRGENGDRFETTKPILGYINEVLNEGEIIAPSGTTYVNPKKKKSFLVGFIDKNVKKRKTAKHAMFVAKTSKDAVKDQLETAKKEGNKLAVDEFERNYASFALQEFFENNNQRNRKLSNNAISGAHASASTPLYNQTGHSSLTSNCRMTSAYGNANNEKLLSGNRHYWSYQTVVNNISSICTHTDYELQKRVFDKYGLHYPTVEETMECIRYSAELYWYSPKKMAFIEKYVQGLTPEQRAAFVYTGDLYQLARLNDHFMRSFLGQLSEKKTTELAVEFSGEAPEQDLVKRAKSYNEDYMALAHQICAHEVRGKGKKYHEMEGTPELHTLVATVANVESVLNTYSDFIQLIMVSDNVPASVPHFPRSIRRAALTSDTDSTIFTTQEWLKWYFGDYRTDQQADVIGATMAFIASQAIIHVLARFSRNAGIEDSRLYTIAMKNEYYFPVYIPTQEGKHYYAIKSAQEGNVYMDVEMEIKGVHLKSSSAPKHISKAAAEMMEDICRTVRSGEKLHLAKYLKQVADHERQVMEDLRMGREYIFRLGQINVQSSYGSKLETSPYVYHCFWEEVMAPKYGSYGEPPYQVIKTSTTLKTPTDLAAWLDGLEDQALANRVRLWCSKYSKKQIPTIQLPVTAIQTHGVPPELLAILDIRKMVRDLSAVFYKVLEPLGFYMLNSNTTNLISDRY